MLTGSSLDHFEPSSWAVINSIVFYQQLHLLKDTSLAEVLSRLASA